MWCWKEDKKRGQHGRTKQTRKAMKKVDGGGAEIVEMSVSGTNRTVFVGDLQYFSLGKETD